MPEAGEVAQAPQALPVLSHVPVIEIIVVVAWLEQVKGALEV